MLEVEEEVRRVGGEGLGFTSSGNIGWGGEVWLLGNGVKL